MVGGIGMFSGSNVVFGSFVGGNGGVSSLFGGSGGFFLFMSNVGCFVVDMSSNFVKGVGDVVKDKVVVMMELVKGNVV